jgi:hypothetical protein
MEDLSQKIINTFIKWREHVETLTKWNGKLPSEEGVNQILSLLEIYIKDNKFCECDKLLTHQEAKEILRKMSGVSDTSRSYQLKGVK